MKQKLLLLLLCFFSLNVLSQTLQTNLFSSGFNAPVDIANAGDSRMFIVERGGKIFITDSSGVKFPTPFLDIDSIVIDGGGERGLLSMAFHPNYNTNGYFFVYYIDNSGNSQIARYNRNLSNPNLALATSKVIVLSVTQPSGLTNHKGGDLNFGADGNLYFGFGDGGGSGDPNNYSQNTQTLLGKMIRINVDVLPYTIPSSNPFVGSAPRDEIWASGLRNPWRWSFDRLTKNMWIADVGQGNYEEINFQSVNSTGGENYGWRCYEGNSAYNTSGCLPQSNYDAPAYVYPHSGPNSGCSATGGYVYRGIKYKSLFGKYLFSDYCSGNLWSLDALYNFTNYGTFGFGIAAFGEDDDGELYLANVSNGNIYKITTNECKPVAYINSPDTSILCLNPNLEFNALKGNSIISYQWMRNGVVDTTGISTFEQFYPKKIGNYQVVVTNTLGCKDTSSTKYVIGPALSGNITGLNFVCNNSSTTLTAAANNVTYQWLKNNIPINGAVNKTYTTTQPGTYKVLVTNNYGCSKTSSGFKVTGPSQAGINILSPTTICTGDSVLLQAKQTGNVSYLWMRNGVNILGQNNREFYAKQSGKYKVTVTNQFACSKTTGSAITVTVNNCNRETDDVVYNRYQLYSAEGTLIHSGIVNEKNNNYNEFFRMLMPQLNGVYVLRVYNQNSFESKVIKLFF